MTQINEKYKLKDVAEPVLMREVFPYKELPKTVFEQESVPQDLPDKVWITDTTFRDGQQARPPYTAQQIADLYGLIVKLDGGAGLIRTSEFFIYSKKDRQALEKCLEMGAEFPEVTSWILPRKDNLKIVKDLGLKETGILTSCSDYHIFLKLKKTRSQAMDMYMDVVEAALDSGIRVRCHFEDITRADIYGMAVPFAVELMKLREKYGLDVRIRACDTLGFGVPWANAALPRSVPKLIHTLRHEAGVPSEMLEWHGHNDFHKVLINAATAWLYGCCAANCSLLGIGERTGNPPLEGMVIQAAEIMGQNDKVNYPVITEIADYFRNEIGFDVPTNYPLVGKDFNTTRAGIHVDGLLKNEEVYNCFDTGVLLNRPIKVAITDKSGAAGLKHWIDDHYGTDVTKDDPRLLAVKKMVEQAYEGGRTTAISDEEMHAWCKEAFGEQ